ncbi:Mitochondrial 50S ribosomal protein [Mycena kentingensis (nom. inval.)]|nr:Mitochondrial 50S ribosomal protein [Mycena kentingensis (nom. inval.)]
MRGERAINDLLLPFTSLLMPPPSQPFKRAQLGLFQNRTKQYGNNVPFSLKKTRRTWLPNVQRKRFFSEALQSYLLPVKVTTTALKTIKKKGGIDNYVLQTSPETLGWKGMELRIKVRDALRKNASLPSPPRTTPPTTKQVDQTSNVSPSRFVRYARRMAARAMGFRGFASAKETIQYLHDQKVAQNRLISQSTPTKTPRANR